MSGTSSGHEGHVMESGGGSFLTFFGEELRIRRDRAGLTQIQVGDRLGWGNGLISKIERGERVPQPDLCEALDTLFGTGDFFRRLGLRARQHAAFSRGLRAYLDREPSARVIATYESHMVPGLLQTEDYARAVIASGRPTHTADEAAALLAMRMTRQDVLDREDPPRLWAIIDESVLTRQVGSPEVSGQQVEHIIAMAERPSVTVQVHPLSAGISPAMGQSFLLAEFREGPDAVYLDAPPGIATGGDDDTVTRFRFIFEHLRASALDERASLARLTQRAEEGR